MKKNNIVYLLFVSTLMATITSCSKSNNDTSNTSSLQQSQTQTLSDFVNVLGQPLYADFVTKATTLNNAVQTLINNPTVANQTAAQQAWVATRVTWEQSEGFLIGPVEDNSYDPNMDTWPTDRNAINALLSSNPNMTDRFLDNVDDALKGFHPLEYYLWDFDPSTYTSPQKNYMTALAANILDQTKALQASWISGGFGNEIINAGKSGSRYTTQRDALGAIANALIDICNEVGETKMPAPFGASAAAADSTQTESPYSHNSIADFTNNIQGAYNSYTCSYGGKTGTSLSSLVQINNKNLDNQIRQAFATAINSFSAFNGTTFEKAIYNNRPAVQNTITAIGNLKALLDGTNGLVNYIQTYIKN